MTCDKSAQIHAYHDGQLPPAERDAVEAHLIACASCAELLADLRRVSEMVAAAPMANVSPIAMARLEKSFYAARDRGVLRVASWLTAAAAAVLLSVSFWPSKPVETTATASTSPAWQTLAVMPPADASDDLPEVVAVAQWMANDLSSGTAGMEQ